VKAAVDGFYEKVLADDRVNGFFKGHADDVANSVRGDILGK
jgi:truncated hemoglobin YjbI